MLVLEAAKKSGAETRGSRTDKDQNTNQRPSAENLTRSASHLCLLVIALFDETVHANTLHVLLVRMTLTVSPQHVKVLLQQCERL